jgi:hypothetical protein
MPLMNRIEGIGVVEITSRFAGFLWLGRMIAIE